MDLSLLIPLLVIALGAAFMYFVGAVIIQALRLSILQVRSDVQIKMDQHQQEIANQQLFLESKKLMLKGKTKKAEEKRAKEDDPATPSVTTVEIGFDGDTGGIKSILESIPWVKKFAIFPNSLLLDIQEGVSPTQIIEAIEKKGKVSVTQVNFAKNPEKTVVKDK
jgi:hypothetical protein